MVNVLFEAHSGWRYIIILLLVAIIVKALIGVVSKGRWGSIDEALNRFTPISIGIGFLLGIILWIVQQRWTGASALESWEHPFTMLIATALGHATSARVKRSPTDAAKFQAALLGYLITGLVVALGVARITGVL